MAEAKKQNETKTTKMELKQPFNINGTRYEAGKDVEVQSDHVQAIKDIQGDVDKQREFETTHHGAVPVPEDPQAPTAQTPTRPLGGPHLRVDEVVRPSGEQINAREIKDPGEDAQASKEVLSEAKGNERTPEEDEVVRASGDPGDLKK